MLRIIRESVWAKSLAVFLALNILLDFAGSKVFALTGGPSQPEVQSFEPIGTDQMVDPFSGDFTYNIPLMDVGGYPINISYHSGITMDMEASWVGLGWNINPGVINRNMRGIPDDFNGDEIETEFYMKPNVTYGVNGTFGVELFGFEASAIGLSFGLGINYNNYKGFGYEQILNFDITSGDNAKLPMNANLGLTGGSEGLSISGDLSFHSRVGKKKDVSSKIGVGLAFNSETGLSEIQLNVSATKSKIVWVQNKLLSGLLGIPFSLPEKKRVSMGGVGHSISMGAPTYSPSLSMPFVNTSLSFSGKFGPTLFGGDATYNITGYYSEQHLSKTSQIANGYGYLYACEAPGSGTAVTDFNREKDGAFRRSTPFMPLSYRTYDIYSVSGQGVGGMFRPYLNSIGMTYDPKMVNWGLGGSLGGELATGNLFKGGLDVSVQYTRSQSGLWHNGNDLKSRIPLIKSGSADFEPVAFKEAGEMTIESDDDFINEIGGRSLISPVISNPFGLQINAENYFRFSDGTSVTSNGAIYRKQRSKRNQVIYPMSALTATYAGLQKQIHYYQRSGSTLTEQTTTRVSDVRKPHHISEIAVYKPDGNRYIYGIPAYNTSQEEVTFNGSDLSEFQNEFLIYSEGVDNKVKNGNGNDEYYSSKKTPPYAHSYLLTAILSPDYSDRDDIDGPSIGDVGSYTYFSYEKIDGYNWKAPYDKQGVGTLGSFNKGIQSDPNDNMCSYTKGDKELWYVRSIETKTHIAIFHTSHNRNDGYDNDQSLNTLRLDSISLYALPDYKCTDPGHVPNPIKTVHFEYDYSLCKHTWNNNSSTSETSGKLTLKEIYFTYGNSPKGKLNRYSFNYSDVNPDYNPTAYDRWGNYMAYDSDLPNNEFPYTDQSTADENAEAWHLKKISLPSGGEIAVDYESDDYAFVMNKRAMEMINVLGFSSTVPTGISSDSNKLYDGDVNKLYITFPILPGRSVTDYILDQNGNKIDWLYFRCNVQIGSDNTGTYENVDGYGKIIDYNEFTEGGNKYGWVRLKSVEMNDRANPNKMANPISKAAWQFGQLNMKRIIEDPSDPGSNSLGDVLQQMISDNIFTQVVEMWKGDHTVYRNKGRGKNVDLEKSFIRLYTPSWSKAGGGSRVSSVRIWDNWNRMVEETTESDYGQEYSYTVEKTFADGITRNISSGVASYEPMSGNEENPWRTPAFYTDEKKMVHDRDFYMEFPVGESFFPSPGVGYSRVVTQNLSRENVTRHATGYTVNEFYTGYDFPVYTEFSVPDHIEKKSNPVLSLFQLNVKDFCGASQGYLIETNDMHGKPKAQMVYAENSDEPISKINYYYKTMAGNPSRLDNTIQVVDKNGVIGSKSVAVDFDLTVDARESDSYTEGGKLKGNLGAFLAAVFPVAFPTIYPGFSSEKTSFKSLTSTKVVSTYGIQYKTVATDLGSTVATENVLYDSETGQVLLTKTSNEFDDPVFSFNYPVHWAYDKMGGAYRNIGVTESGRSFINGVGTVSDVNNFVVGDEVMAFWMTGLGYPNGKVLWVAKVDVATNEITLIDKTAGLFTNSGCSISVIRSGRRNMQSLSAGAVTMSVSPIVKIGVLDTLIIDADKKILDASATEYSDVWQMPGTIDGCDNQNDSACSDCGLSCESMLRFFNGLLGHFIDTIELNDYCYYLVPKSGPAILCGSPTYSGYISSGQLYADLQNCDGNSYSLFNEAYIVSPPGASLSIINQFDDCSEAGFHSYYLYFSYFDSNGVLQNDGKVFVNLKNHPYACQKGSNEFQCFVPERGGEQVINPFVEGVRGIWRTLRTHKYVGPRDQNLTSGGNTEIRTDGAFKYFSPFWDAPSGSIDHWSHITSDLRWTWTSEVTKYDTDGAEIENRDALGRFSSAQFAYRSNLPVAVAANSMHKEMGYEGFEDGKLEYCLRRHFNFDEFANSVTEDYAHTGWFSMYVGPQSNVYVNRCLTPKTPAESTEDAAPFVVHDADYIGYFSPNSNESLAKKFVLSFWVKVGEPWRGLTTYSNIGAELYVNTTPLSSTMSKSKIIDGWQQYTYVFTVPASSTGNFKLSLVNNNSSAGSYFDDIRVFPFDGSMKNYVYDYLNHRLMAELDNNNFATFYEYDEEGRLIRVKKETERGIFTIQQSINHAPEDTLDQL